MIPYRMVPNKVMHNPTTPRSKYIHAYAWGGYPLCGQYMKKIVYTDVPVNCPRCLRAREMENRP